MKVESGQLYKVKDYDKWIYIISVNSTERNNKAYDTLIDAIEGSPHEGLLKMDSVSYNVRLIEIKDLKEPLDFKRSYTAEMFIDLMEYKGIMGKEFTIYKDTVFFNGGH